MYSNISVPEDDLCKYCDQKCPENIYNCTILQQAMNSKKAVYKWVWIKKD
jgi:hypothetical protein